VRARKEQALSGLDTRWKPMINDEYFGGVLKDIIYFILRAPMHCGLV
jgi:hypothetical protein